MDERRYHRRMDRELKRIERDWRYSEIDQQLDRLKADEGYESPVHWAVHLFVWVCIIGTAYLSVLVCNQVIRSVWRFIK